MFEGDDLRRLASEIALCRKFLLQSRSYRYCCLIYFNNSFWIALQVNQCLRRVADGKAIM